MYVICMHVVCMLFIVVVMVVAVSVGEPSGRFLDVSSHTHDPGREGGEREGKRPSTFPREGRLLFHLLIHTPRSR